MLNAEPAKIRIRRWIEERRLNTVNVTELQLHLGYFGWAGRETVCSALHQLYGEGFLRPNVEADNYTVQTPQLDPA